MAEFVSRSLRSSRSSRYSLCAVSRTLSFERISYFYIEDNQELELVGMKKLDDRPPKGAIILPEWARKDPRNLASTSGVWTAISAAYFDDEDARRFVNGKHLDKGLRADDRSDFDLMTLSHYRHWKLQ
jgi:hypothetical protein